MSRSDRDDKARHLGQFGFFTAIILSCLLVGFFAYLEGYQSEREQNSTYEYQQTAKRNAQIACREMEPAAIADCVYDEIASAREQSEAQQDLNAQQWMARWAGILVIISLATTLISWFALRYLRDTFVETRKAVEETAKATEAMREANQIMAISSEAQLRPYLTITDVKFESVYDNTVYGRVEISNHGVTPAIIESVEVATWVGPQTQIAPHRTGPAMEQDYHFKDVLPPNTKDSITFDCRHTSIPDIHKDAEQFYVYGKVSFRDVFNKHHWIRFAYRNSVFPLHETEQFRACIDGNDSSQNA